MPTSPRPFRFQRFEVHHDQCGMKIGTDSVLLGAWARVEQARRILDIGTGSGLLALMLAQRTERFAAQIDAIEVEESAANQAMQNANNSPWQDRIHVSHVSVQDWSAQHADGGYDHCVCNPPYFNASFPSDNHQQRLARHNFALTRQELFECSYGLLNVEGRLSLVLPFDQLDGTRQIANQRGFFVTRQTSVRPMPDKPFKRVLLEFGLQRGNAEQNELTVERSRHDFTSEYESLTNKFHLRFADG